MTSATERIAQYNKEVGQPRGGLVNPKLLTVTQFDDRSGVLDHRIENQQPSTVVMAVDHLSRLADIRLGVDDSPVQLAGKAFRGSLLGARRPANLGLTLAPRKKRPKQHLA